MITCVNPTFIQHLNQYLLWLREHLQSNSRVTWRSVCSFICQVASARRQRSDQCGFQVKLPLVATILTTQKVE